eukprot:1340058-Amorphochlora_amoeboformis.AAC.1
MKMGTRRTGLFRGTHIEERERREMREQLEEGGGSEAKMREEKASERKKREREGEREERG